MVGKLLRGGRSDRDGFIAPRVERSRDPLDVAAFAGGVPTLIGDNHRDFAEIEFVMKLVKAGLFLFQHPFILLLVNAAGKVDLAEARHFH